MIRFFLSLQFLKFVAVGGTAAFLNWASCLVFLNWMPFSAAVISAYVVGMTTGFVLNSVFVFPDSNKPWVKQATGFFLVNIAFAPVVWGASIGLNILFSNVDGLRGYSTQLSHGIAVGLPAILTFLIYKFFTFAGDKNA